MKWISSLALVVLLGAASSAGAETIVDFTGNTNGALATGTAAITFDGVGSFTGSITNTSPFAAVLTGFGFDLTAGNLNGFSGTPDPITMPAGVDFDFEDGDLGNVPQFNTVDLDVGYITGANFTGGNPTSGLDAGDTLMFTITGPLAGFTEAQIASALFARFQQVGPNGDLSDVSTVTQTVIPEPASMLLFGTGLAYLARRRLRKADV